MSDGSHWRSAGAQWCSKQATLDSGSSTFTLHSTKTDLEGAKWRVQNTTARQVYL